MYILIQLVDWQKDDEVVAGKVLKVGGCSFQGVKILLSKHMKDMASLHDRDSFRYATALMDRCMNLDSISRTLRTHTEWRVKFKMAYREGWYE
ncbi:hypothetical protein LP114_073 [Listeria phage LP-114]|uniref:Uncharacterized protein n=1 Tax=Listeria phage LP-114 TaxID=1458857 RepID=A0A059T7M1_9CAUD|nr:hypothetical protein LP114_073 [Listeria phage LP-114]AHL18661.1 hypothetical protein LP114_073 [Listeria phage LP-114]